MKFFGVKQDGKFVLYDKQLFQNRIDKFKEGQELELSVEKVTNQRSQMLNRYYWAVIVEAIADHTGEDKQAIHEYLKNKFNKKPVTIKGKTINLVVSTTALSTEEFLDYVERCRMWGIETFDQMIFPDISSF